MSTRADDIKVDAELSFYLDNGFYNKLPFNVKRTNDKKHQFSGIDVIFERDGKEKYVDEKAAIYYTNKDLNTFAFEIFFTNRANEEMLGWFIDDNLKTDFYSLMYLKSFTDKQVKDLTSKDFSEIDVILISKKKLREFVESRISLESLFELGHNMIRDGIRRTNISDDLYCVVSDKLSEKPFNVIIRKETLRELSTLSATIKTESR